MKNNFSDNEDALANTVEVMEKCELELDLGRYLIPGFPRPVRRDSGFIP